MAGLPTTRAQFQRQIDRAIASGDMRDAVMLMVVALATIGPRKVG